MHDNERRLIIVKDTARMRGSGSKMGVSRQKFALSAHSLLNDDHVLWLADSPSLLRSVCSASRPSLCVCPAPWILHQCWQ